MYCKLGGKGWEGERERVGGSGWEGEGGRERERLGGSGWEGEGGRVRGSGWEGEGGRVRGRGWEGRDQEEATRILLVAHQLTKPIQSDEDSMLGGGKSSLVLQQ